MESHTYKFSKLVRDSSLENLLEKGAKVESRTLNGPDYRQQLALKLVEESHEVCNAANQTELCEELADILEILSSLAQSADISMEQVEQTRSAKHSKRGGFEKRLFVDTVECPAGSFWDEYCARDPQKYPRV